MPCCLVLCSPDYLVVVDYDLRFTGLVAFPFDRLKCAMEWGAWILSDGFQAHGLTDHPGFLEPGWLVPDNFETLRSPHISYDFMGKSHGLSFFDVRGNKPIH